MLFTMCLSETVEVVVFCLDEAEVACQEAMCRFKSVVVTVSVRVNVVDSLRVGEQKCRLGESVAC